MVVFAAVVEMALVEAVELEEMDEALVVVFIFSSMRITKVVTFVLSHHQKRRIWLDTECQTVYFFFFIVIVSLYHCRIVSKNQMWLIRPTV